MGRILIKNGKVWNGEKFFFADVLTENKRIIRVEENITETADFVFDASGKIVAPGLVDAHVHFKGISSEEFGINAEMACLPFGVTAAVDAGGGLGNKEQLDFMAVKNRVFVSVQVKDNKACFENTKRLFEVYGDKVIGLKLYFGIEVSDLKDIQPLKQTVDFAEEHGLMVMVHSTNPPVSMKELLSVLRKGDILTHAYHGGTYNVADDNYECVFEAKNRGVIIDAGMAGHVHTDFKVFEDAIKCGALPDIISTDITKFSAYKRGGRYGLTMCMSIAKHLGMTEEDIFKAVTSSPAKALGMDKEWGFLGVGRCADVSVLEYAEEGFDLTDNAGNNINAETGYRCVLTVSGGDVVYKR